MIFYLAREGIAWAQLPHDFPPHQTVYGMFTRWARHGAWQQIHDALRDLVRVHEGRDPLPTAAIITPSRYAAPTPCPVEAAATMPGRRSTAGNGMLTTFINTLMSAEADAICGAPYGQSSPERTNARNGYRNREFDTRVATDDRGCGSEYPVASASLS